MVDGYASGQWTAGALSNADTKTTTTSTAELLHFYTPKVQPYIQMSSAFTNKALASGAITQAQLGSGQFFSANGQQYNAGPAFTQEVAMITPENKQTPIITTPTISGTGMLPISGNGISPILMIGVAAFLLLGGLK
jgi:hypothetical protein